MTVKDALEALKDYPDSTDIVIRRRLGTELFWYAENVRDIRKLAHLEEYSLEYAFDLHEYKASDSYQRRDFTRQELDKLSGVLLDGERVLGVLEALPYSGAKRSGAITSESADDLAEPYAFAPPLPAPEMETTITPTQTISPYPRLDAPNMVDSGQEFDLTIGLSREPYLGVTGEQMMDIAVSEEEFDMIVQVFAEGFRSPQGLRRFLHVSRSRFEEANVTVKLIAPEVNELLLGVLEVQYSYQGNLVGRGWREIQVIPRGVSISPPSVPVKTGSTPITYASQKSAPDLTVTIKVGRDERTLLWAFDTNLVTVPSDGEVKTDLGRDNARTYAFNNIQGVAEVDGTTAIDNKVRGIARRIARNMPAQFWDVLAKVWLQVKKARPRDVPSLLIVSEDPYIPWELAITEEPFIDKSLVDSTRPPIIGAQLKIGRWLPPGPSMPGGLLYPKLPPETAVTIEKMALVVGDYASSGKVIARPLPEAIEEGKDIKKLYPAIWIDGSLHDLDRLLDNEWKEDGEEVNFQAVHFACHGQASSDPKYTGIVLSDTVLRLGEDMIVGNKMTPVSQPFVFLNACQLGQASETLGDYGGLAAAFLEEGCRGFIAPLWSVNDKIAREVGVNFYKRVLDDGFEVSEVMREMRSKFDMEEDKPPATYIAYIFYGHPKLVVTRAT
jgi:hypothetical protein